MQKRIKTKTLHRDSEHRKALIKNLSTSLVMHEEIVTTEAKAKYLRSHFEKLVSKAKKGNSFNMVKMMKTKLSEDKAVRKMFDEIGPRFVDRAGGYTRIIKIGNRSGDNAPMAKIEILKGEKSIKTEENKSKQVKAKKGAKND